MRNTNLRPLVVREIDRLITGKAVWLAKRYGLQQADVEDIKQAGWETTLRALPGYNRKGSTLQTYLSSRLTFAMLEVIFKAQAHGLTGGVLAPQFTDIEEPVASNEAVEEYEGDIYLPEAIQDLLADPGQEDSLMAVADAQGALDRLGTRERNLLTLYFGLSGKRPLTLRELSSRNKQPIGVIYKRIARGLEMLKDDIEQDDGAV